jgi:hypothetical protein
MKYVQVVLYSRGKIYSCTVKKTPKIVVYTAVKNYWGLHFFQRMGRLRVKSRREGISPSYVTIATGDRLLGTKLNIYIL